jgi:hypothetical protein
MIPVKNLFFQDHISMGRDTRPPTTQKCPFPLSTKSPKMPFRISILERICMSQLIPDPNFLPPTLDIVFKS